MSIVGKFNPILAIFGIPSIYEVDDIDKLKQVLPNSEEPEISA